MKFEISMLNALSRVEVGMNDLKLAGKGGQKGGDNKSESLGLFAARAPRLNLARSLAPNKQTFHHF